MTALKFTRVRIYKSSGDRETTYNWPQLDFPSCHITFYNELYLFWLIESLPPWKYWLWECSNYLSAIIRRKKAKTCRFNFSFSLYLLSCFHVLCILLDTRNFLATGRVRQTVTYNTVWWSTAVVERTDRKVNPEDWMSLRNILKQRNTLKSFWRVSDNMGGGK